MSRLELRHVRKAFGGLDVLADISLSVGAGEFVSILGPSGAGKSTLFQLLTGAEHGEGEMLFDGAPLDDHGRHFAFMPQRDALMPWRRILDNATLGLEVQGMRRQAARARVAPLFAEFGLAGFERHFPAQLSGGMRQRAALLRTVVQQRDMLLLDEPFGALDALTRTAMQRWLEQMWRHHRWTALLITHDVREAVFLSDRIYVLSARPARIVREIKVPLPRPRSLGGDAARQASTLEAEILDIILNATPSKGHDHD
ncbi:MAG: ABC transporter ATP-binding protein [Mesorhizobium sp.]|uniref:ABC transporter ATP-binding protein n=1 Tax=unclassified Mesorhizobium TaxID=325217 RepID=UPI000FCA4B16|nr:MULTISPECIES: ABC transporter ATP-binding protein [unclassified Mesorhizobium]RWN18695.1 MAG: ABC transporter ATP-binding protein [Mesorhizobium sp.]RUT84717.1 ABC transporter ATP-binding protein [Mesorhizobium sp. M7A.T.Ca.US.000.02.2.1]RUT89192.1 ABC transporter ATP-binding protein [Mesorhizobium sp. M7A.T.Ca.US.000.02.1.1]RWO40378.1 MAG: ABC transporter ATP-binding protein [Mesorhizobium sp.]TJV25201.1 MAG: ABC transporter ATP-binding protein [Mesorhizobium sp.]